jgi:ABC-type branched-subunit amino acid transport system ATPase component/ABC-type branched-subunit amino acid transport system permease subunit
MTNTQPASASPHSQSQGSVETSAFERADIPLPSYIRVNHVLGLLFFIAVWVIAPSYSQFSQVMMLTIIYAIIGASLIIVFGLAGQLTLGHTVFVATGAFLSANITAEWGRGLETEIPIAFAVAMLLGLVVGLPTLRVSELYLALATFAIAFVGVQVLFEWKWFTDGGTGKPAGPLQFFGYEFERGVTLVRISLVVIVIVFWLVGNLIDGRTGRAMNALRTSETAAKSVGLPVPWLKILAFGLGGGFAGVAGVLYIHAIRRAIPENFGVNFSIIVILTLIIGGSHRLSGAVIGATFVRWLPELFRDIQEYEGIIYGSVLIILTLFSPTGLVGLFENSFTWIRNTIRPKPAPDIQHIEGQALSSPYLSDLASDKKRGHLVVESATVTFGGVHAVEDVSFEIEPGAVTGLIGSNGAGKTTCFNAITGHVSGAEGRFLLDGKDITGLPIHRRALAGMGRTFQNLNLHGDMTVLHHALLGLDRELGYGKVSEFLRLPRVLKAERAAHYRAAELLDHMGLLEHWNDKVEDLPYGLQKRVDVVRAMATNPSILLLDEPAAGLPTAEAAEMMEHVRLFAEFSGAGLLVIEHNVELVADVCERVIVMDAGRILADGTAQEVMADDRVIAAYLGT